MSYMEDQPLMGSLPDDDDDTDDNDSRSDGGGDVFRASEHPFFQHLLERSRAYKKRHWWIFSRGPDAGKMTALKFIKRKCYAFEGKGTNGFWHEFDPNSQFVLFDEYGNSAESVLPISELNLICDGNYSFNKKYCNAQRLNTDQPIVIIFSNFHPQDVYGTTDSNQAGTVPLLYARFNVVELATGLNNDGRGSQEVGLLTSASSSKNPGSVGGDRGWGVL